MKFIGLPIKRVAHSLHASSCYHPATQELPVSCTGRSCYNCVLVRRDTDRARAHDIFNKVWNLNHE